MSYIKSIIKNIPIFYRIHNFFSNGFWKKGLEVIQGGDDIILSRIRVRQNGSNNKIYIGKGVRLINCLIWISGSNNEINIGDGCSLCGTNFYIENDNNRIWIGEKTTTTDKVDICVIEGTKVHIGEDCMISSDIYMATGDGHSVCNFDCTHRTNVSKDIVIGNHVWIGTRVIIGKGVKIGDNSIVAAGSVCNASINVMNNTIIGGNPATTVKKDINWVRERI